MARKPIKFTSVGEQLGEANQLDLLLAIVESLNQINQLVAKQMPAVANICHCGAIDYSQDLLVFYANNNAAFYRLNTLIPELQHLLASNGFHFAKILVKVKQSAYQSAKVRHKIDDKQRAMLEQFASAIGRPDLLKSPQAEPEEVNSDAEEWQIKL